MKCSIVQNPAERGNTIDLLTVEKYLERIEDRAKIIAGWVLFSITGEKSIQPPQIERWA